MVMVLCEDSGATSVYAEQRVCDDVVWPDPNLLIRSAANPGSGTGFTACGTGA